MRRVPSLILSNPLGADDAQEVGLEPREFRVGEVITVSDYVFATLIRTGYGIPYGVVEDILLKGNGSPTASTGIDGQWYLDLLNEVLWGPKVGGYWPSDPIRPDRGVQQLRLTEDYRLIVTYSTGTEVDLGNIRGPAGPAPVPATATQQGVLRLAGDFGGTADNPTVPGLADKIPLEQKGAASGVASLGGDGKVPIAQLPAGSASGVATLGADGKLPAAQLPDLAVTQFLGSTNSQTAMLAKVGQRGDWTVRTDLGTTWIVTAEPSNVIGSWTQLSYPAAPVTTVAGKAGAVTLVSADITDATAAATANMLAKRDGNGRMAVAAGAAAGDAANVGQLATFGRDRGTGTTLPTTDLRRGDTYTHTALGFHVYEGSRWIRPDAPSGTMEGTAVYAYGHSYVASDFFGQGPQQRYINRAAARLNFQAINRAASGWRMMDTALDAIGSRYPGRTWAPGTKGVVVLDCTLNDASSQGTAAAALAGYRHALRAFANFVSCETVIDSSAAGWTVNGAESTNLSSDYYGGSNRSITTGATTTWSRTFTGTEITVGMFGIATAAGEFDILIDGTVRATVNCAAQCTASTVSGITRDYVPLTVRISGLTNASHTLLIRPKNGVAATGLGPFLDWVGFRSATPPRIVVVKCVPVPDTSKDAAIAAYNAIIDEVAAEFPNMVVVDPSVGWNRATMIGSDGVHLSAAGNAHLAAVLTRALDGLPHEAGSTSVGVAAPVGSWVTLWDPGPATNLIFNADAARWYSLVSSWLPGGSVLHNNGDGTASPATAATPMIPVPAGMGAEVEFYSPLVTFGTTSTPHLRLRGKGVTLESTAPSLGANMAIWLPVRLRGSVRGNADGSPVPIHVELRNGGTDACYVRGPAWQPGFGEGPGPQIRYRITP